MKRGGTLITTRVSSSAGVVYFDDATGGSYDINKRSSYTQPVIGISRWAGLVSPAPGESFLAPAELRLIASGGLYTDGADKVDFYVDDTLVGSVLAAAAEFAVFKTRALGIAAGSHQVWARAWWGTTYHDSRPHPITVSAPPTYARTINLTGDTPYTSSVLDLGLLAGTPSARLRVNGNGFRITGNAAAALTWAYLDFYGLGATSGVTTTYGVDVTTTGNVAIDNCRFDGCSQSRVTSNGSSTVAFTNNLSRSNSRNPLGQAHDASGGDPVHGSYAAFEFAGNSSGAKVCEGNNIAAGWLDFTSANWTIGGSTVAKANICQGPRVGFFLSGAATGTIRLNFTHHIYFSGWSQASNYELGNISSLVVEHNVIVGSNWNIRGCDGVFRYNLVLVQDAQEGAIWTGTGAADIHHCILRGASGFGGRGLMFGTYPATNARIRNCTVDGVNNAGDPLVELSAGAGGVWTLNSCLFARGSSPAIRVGSGDTLTADYNDFFSNAGTLYSDRGPATHDRTANPGFAALPTEYLPFDLAAVWNRTKTVTSILNDYRGYYTPTAGVLDVGDPAIYGAGNDIGAVGVGTANAFDLFGTQALYGPQATQTRPAGSVLIAAGSTTASRQTLINANPNGTSFWLASGTHAATGSNAPKTGNVFTGEYGAVIDGTGWARPESDLDAAPFKAIANGVTAVEIRNLVIQNMPSYGVNAYLVAGWKIDHCEIASCRTGLCVGDTGQVTHNRIHHNVGTAGDPNPALRGGGFAISQTTGVLFDHNDVYSNGTEQKFIGGTGGTDNINFTVTRNEFHDNTGNGFWSDGYGAGGIVRNNVSSNNVGNGIVIEKGKSVTVDQNTCERNGELGVSFQSTRDSFITNNILTNNVTGMEFFVDLDDVGTNGWSIDLRDNVVTGNRITVLRNVGTSFAVTLGHVGTGDFTPYTSNTKNNTCQSNTYYAADTTSSWFSWNGNKSFTQWKALPQDSLGTIQVG